MNADEFNALYEVGTPVFAYPGARPEDIPSATRLVTRTRSKAQMSASGDPVVWVDGEGAYICLTHVDPVSESVWKAAKEAEETPAAVAAQGALPVPVGDQPQPLDDTRLAEIREWTSKRAAALAEWLDKFSPVDGQRALENAETVLEEDVPALLAEIDRLRAERHTTNEALSDAAEQLRTNRDRIAELEAQRERAEKAEAGLPSRFRATPAEVDWYLRKILTEETLLNYQRAIGNRAVEEAAEEIRQETARLKAHGVLEPDKDWAAATAADWIDTSKEGGHFPSKLLCARHGGFNPCPGAPRCTPREDEAVS